MIMPTFSAPFSTRSSGTSRRNNPLMARPWLGRTGTDKASPLAPFTRKDPTPAGPSSKIGERDWSKLAHRFGHKLAGRRQAGRPLSGLRWRWLRRSRCSAWRVWPIAGQTIRRSGTIVASAQRSRSIGKSIVERYGKLAIKQRNPKSSVLGSGDIALPWTMEAQSGLNPSARCCFIALEDYFRAWQASCKQLKAAADLPIRL
jgi:hypothetical protein